jgi:cytochrome b pre-mRNA-processing protein 3
MGLLNALGLAARPAGDVDRLYGAIVGQARRPEFYLRCGVPDTVAGRFDMVALHAYIVLRRLKELGAPCARLAQALFDRMFVDLDHNLREMGVGDLAVGHRIKDLAKSFYGRIKAYDEGLAGDGTALEAALRRNAFAETTPTPAQVAALALYLRSAVADSRSWAADALARAEIVFPAAPRFD